MTTVTRHSNSNETQHRYTSEVSTAEVNQGSNGRWYYEGLIETATGEKEYLRGSALSFWDADNMARTICTQHPSRA